MLQEEQIIKVNINLLVPNQIQPRKIFNDNNLKALTLSIKKYGIINPLLVRKLNDKYEIISGERRYRAAKLLNLQEVPVIVKNISEQEIREIALVDNLQREKLNPIEEATEYAEIIKLTNIPIKELSEQVGKSETAIENKLILLKLPITIQQAIANQQISEQHARILSTVNDPQQQQLYLEKIITEKMTVKELEEYIKLNSQTEEDITLAIEELMKSVDENLKKEEKDSENMNNENFFPNYNPQTYQNNTSLNAMNAQSMNNPTMPPQPETVMPSSPIQSFNQPMMDQSMMDQSMVMNGQPMQQPSQENMIPTPMSSYEQQPQMLDQPLFDQSLTQQPLSVDNQQYQSMNQSMPQMPEISSGPELLPTQNNSELILPTNEPVVDSMIPAPSYEVPIQQDQPTNNSVLNVEQVVTILTQNGIPYKKYSNETQNCIIIEI